MKKKIKYNTGGSLNVNQKQDLSTALGMVSGVAPMFGPIGIGVGAAAGLGSTLLNNSAEKQMKGPHLASFAGYNTGGELPSSSQSDYTTKSRRKSKNKPDESGRQTLRKGDTNDEVYLMQQFLKNKGFYKGDVDGIFGNLTEDAVKGYQKWFNDNSTYDVNYIQGGQKTLRGKSSKIKVDGIVGDETRSALMYREEMKTPSKKEVKIENKVGKLVRNYEATDETRIKGYPDPFDPIGALALTGAGLLLGSGLGEAASAISSPEAALYFRTINTLPKGGVIPKQIPGGNIIPKGSNITPRSFPPKTPSSYGTRIGYETGGPMDPPNYQYIEYQGRKVKFDSNKGVPLMLGGKPLGNSYAIQDLDQGMWFDVERGNDGTYSSNSGPRMSIDNIIDNRMGGSGESSKTKSKDKRFQEKANGGFMDVSSDSFEVDGDPNVKDSEFYAPKGVFLDDKEIVKDDFVFSNRIKNPLTGRTFAEEAGKIERATAKAEKRNLNSSDPIAMKTIEMNNRQSQKLAKMQEGIAHMLGLREDSIGMANGGPFDPLPGQQFIEIYSGPNGVKQYYDPYNKRQVFRKSSTGTYFAARDNYALPEQGVIDAHLQQYPGQSKSPSNIDARGYDPMTGVKDYMVGFNNTKTSGAPFVIDPLKDVPQGDLLPTPVRSGNTRTPVKSTGRIPTNPIKPINNSPQSMDWRVINGEYDPAKDMPVYPMDTIPYISNQSPLAADGLGAVQSINPNKLDMNQYKIAQTPAEQASPVEQTNNYNKYTTGDYMQIAAALSRLGNFERAEVDLPNLDTTDISKQSYDVNPILAQNNRNYQNALNNTNASSPNLRRALANQLYGQKLNQDSNSLNQYQQMNNQAQVSYEDRLSNRRRFNAGQTSYTQNINAQNRGAARNARQSAFDQLGTVGMMLNQKKQSQAYINALKVRYPDISDSVLQDILGG